MTTPEPFPPVASLLPHSGANVFLTKVLAKSGDEIACLGVCPNLADLGLPPMSALRVIGIEIASQAVAAYAALERNISAPAAVGYLIAIRHCRLHPVPLAAGDVLEVRCKSTWRDNFFGIFDCHIHLQATQQLLLEGALSFYQPLTAEPHE